MSENSVSKVLIFMDEMEAEQIISETYEADQKTFSRAYCVKDKILISPVPKQSSKRKKHVILFGDTSHAE